MKLDFVVLTKTDSQEVFEMTSQLINSLLTIRNEIYVNQIILVESGTTELFEYRFSKVIVVRPPMIFNYHAYINYALGYCSAEFIAVCNNDLIFSEGWFESVLNLKYEQPDIMSFSPVDPWNSGCDYSRYGKKKFFLGYNIRSEVAGWCIVFDKTIKDLKDLFDERFDFYFADNDYALNLKKHSVKHALVLDSFVYHFGGKSSSNINSKISIRSDYFWFQRELRSEKSKWIVSNRKMLDGYLKFHKKWGSNYSLRVRRSIIERLHLLEKFYAGYYFRHA